MLARLRTMFPPQDPAIPTVVSALRNPRLLRTEVLAGLVVALALIPEAIAFSIVAGVDPRVGLFAAFTMAVVTAVLGGRPAMISGATGAIALVVAPVVKEHGLDYLLATVILGGIIQLVAGGLGVAKLMRFVPRSVMIGFVNALAILIALSQLTHLENVPWLVYVLVTAGLVIIFVMPKLTKVVPAPLVAIAILTVITVVFSVNVPTVGDEGELPNSLPTWLIPDVPFNAETLSIIAPSALAMAIVGLLESLMSAKLVDDVTDSHSDKTRESLGQGTANVISGFFGGMGGCAMVGQTMINVKASGARTRVSSFLAGTFLLGLVVGLGDVVAQIPMAALVAVMLVVAFGTMDWHSIAPRTLKVMPRSETLVMLSTVVVTVATHNLAYGVVVGVVVAMVAFARRVAHLTTVERIAELDTNHDGTIDTRTYRVTGELFFASSNDLVYQFDYAGDPDHVVIDMTDADLWDASTVAALDAVHGKCAAKGKHLEVIGLDGASLHRYRQLSGQLDSGH